MSKSDLKAAMDSLQIKKPFRFPSKQPHFTPPPPVADATEVHTETMEHSPTKLSTDTPVLTGAQVAESTRDLTGTDESVPTRDADDTRVMKETQVLQAISVEIKTQVASSALVETETQVAINTSADAATGVPVASPVRAASEQDSSVTLEALSAPKLHHGYSRLPNAILMRMAAGEFIKSEMQILLVIARFTISFQKRHAPLSKSVLERQTGLRGPAVLQAIGSLIESKMIEKIPGDRHRPNQLGLVFDDTFDFFGKNKAPVATGTPVEKPSMVRESPQDEIRPSALVHRESPTGVGGAAVKVHF